MISKMKFIFINILLFTSLPVYGQGFFLSKHYSNDDYSSSKFVWDIAQDSLQRIYFGTDDSGANIYNGVSWNSLHIGNSGRAKIFYQSDSRFYASGENDFGFFSADSSNNLTFISLKNRYKNQPKTINQHHSIQNYKGHIVFYGTLGLDVFDGDSLTHYPIKNVLNAFAPSVINGGNYYGAFRDGLISFDGPNTEIITNKFFQSDTITSMFTKGEDVYLTSSRAGLSKLNGDSLFKVKKTFVDFLDKNFVYTSITDSLNKAFFGTLSGGLLIEYGDENEEIFNQSSGLASNMILTLHKDHENILWIGTSDGLQTLLTDIPIRVFKDGQGISNQVEIIKTHNNQRFIRQFGIWKYWNQETGEFTQIQTIDDSFKTFNHNGKLIFYNDQVSYVVSNDGQFIQDNRWKNPVFVKNSDSLQWYSDGYIYELNDGSFSEVLPVEPDFEFNEIIKFEEQYYFRALDYRTNGYNQIMKPIHGIFDEVKIVGSENESFKINQFGIIASNLTIATDGENAVNGFFQLSKDKSRFEKPIEFKKIDSELVSKQVFVFEECKNGDIWLENNKKIKRLYKNGDEYVISESPYQLIGEQKAIYDIECENDGTIWFAGNEGLYHLLEADWNYKTNFKTNVTGTFIDQDSLIYGGFGEPSNEIILPYKDNALRFTYAAASYIDPERNTYSYKLEGFDAAWSDFSLETQKDYTNIPEGDYVFKVKSKNVFGVEGSTDSFAFTILPPWYRTWWAYLLYVIGISGLIYSAHRIRLNQLLKVERMRTKIASDLHDEVSATLTGISYFAEAVKTDKDEHRKSHFINLITESAGDAKEKITDIVWSITPENDNWELFLSKCRRYASDLLESSEIKYNLNITETIDGALPMNVRQHLWMIFKEMLTNTVRHSQASQLDVILDVEDGILKLIVQDNGKGFDVDSDRMGNGVSNIKKRANEIGANIDLISEPEMGSRWRLELKL